MTSFSSGADDEALTTGESKQTNFSHIFKSIMNIRITFMAEKFWVSYDIKNDHKVTNINSFLYFICRKRKSYHNNWETR